MLSNVLNQWQLSEDNLKQEWAKEKETLSALQMRLKEKKLPVMVVFEGWGSAGKGSVISDIIKNIDPRFFSVATLDQDPTDQEKRYPFLRRYFLEIPEEGTFKFFDTCFMPQVTTQMINKNLKGKKYQQTINSINITERQLVDNGYLLLKFFFHISEKEQKRRLKELVTNKDTRWRVNENDLWENNHYSKVKKIYNKYLSDTNQPIAPWYIIDSTDRKEARLNVIRVLNQALTGALNNGNKVAPIPQNRYRMAAMPKLSDVPLDNKLTKDEYRKRLKKLQKKLHALHYKLYRKKIPVIIAYEGWDAAGKGGNIKRIASALDPRGYIVHPIASPEPHEKSRHFLWRFVTRLPKTGHIAIFDRTWYGRVMVERLEGFCSENDWQRAYNEINEFEKALSDWGAVIIKFWVQIDNETQLNRFNDRQNTPEKQWKITDEDWRNREKWDLYEQAVNEMIEKTSTTYAPWNILPSVDKQYARILALETVISQLEAACKMR